MTNSLYLREDIIKAENKLFEQGVSVRSLIERAGEALANSVEGADSVTVMVGGGNNGADGAMAGIILADRGVSVLIFTVGEIKSAECAKLLEEAEDSGIEIRSFESGYAVCDEVILDCIFGIGLKREVEGIYLDAIRAIRESGARVISADIPSGLSVDSGKIMGIAVQADLTVSFSGKKVGYFLNDGPDTTGDIIYADVGINPINDKIKIIEEVTFPKRKNNTHKGSYGKLSIIAGSAKYVGASLLAEQGARAAMRAGAGLVKLCVPSSLAGVYASRVLESTLFPLPDVDGKILFEQNAINELISDSDVIVIGPGLGVSAEIVKLVKYVIENFPKTVILDADALNSISCNPEILKGGKDVVITPHPGEFARLTDKTVKDIDPIADSLAFAKEYGVTLHLKGVGSVTAKPDGTLTVTCSGTPAMAKGGSGDVLTGVAGAFYAQKIDNAMEKASFTHALSGRLSEKRFGEYGVLARDIADSVAQIISERIR